jgi:hypothetical protein
MSSEAVAKARAELEIKVEGQDCPAPITAFKHLLVDLPLQKQIARMNYPKPTPIQCQALPCALSGRDVIGIAKTGTMTLTLNSNLCRQRQNPCICGSDVDAHNRSEAVEEGRRTGGLGVGSDEGIVSADSGRDDAVCSPLQHHVCG